MKRIKQLIEGHKQCWHIRNEYEIKWRIEFQHRDIPACTIFFIPTIVYNTYPYRQPGGYVFQAYFLHWYLGIGEWCLKEKNDGRS